MNDGFSRGDRKRAETLQLAVLQPKCAALDETDSGLDLDTLRTVSEGVSAQRGPNLGTLVITRYQRLRECSVPD